MEMLDFSQLSPALVGWISLYHSRISRLVSWLVYDNNRSVLGDPILYNNISYEDARIGLISSSTWDPSFEKEVVFRVHAQLESWRHVCRQGRYKNR